MSSMGGHAVSKVQEVELGRQIIGRLFQSFARGDWNETTRACEKTVDLKTHRAVRQRAYPDPRQYKGAVDGCSRAEKLRLGEVK